MKKSDPYGLPNMPWPLLTAAEHAAVECMDAERAERAATEALHEASAAFSKASADMQKAHKKTVEAGAKLVLARKAEEDERNGKRA